MEIVLEHNDIDRLLRVGLAAEGVRVPEGCALHLRANNKKSTLRAVYRPAKREGFTRCGSPRRGTSAAKEDR